MKRYRNTILALMDAVPALIEDALPADIVREAIRRGTFRPAEDDALGFWFSRFLTVRQDLRDLLHDLEEVVDAEITDIESLKDWRCLVIGFATACLLVRLDRFLVFEFARHKMVQRKLNEAFPEHRIPRKSYSKIFSAYTDPVNMWRLNDAIKLVKKKKYKVRDLESDEIAGPVVVRFPEIQAHINSSKLSYLRRALLYLRHKWRRRGASAKHKTMFLLFEAGGRIAAKMNPGKEKLVTQMVRDEIFSHLQPGDIFITRHRYALTNYFLPGTWPHAALYVGTEQQREDWGIKVSPPVAHRWRGDKCTLEALRDGVLFRPLAETLNVDAFVVVRPKLSREAIADGISRVVRHEGKLYKFDFDFFSSDRLVCTEVIYRTFDGLENMQIPLTERAGRKTLSAEDILDLALDTELFELVSVFGYPEKITSPLFGDKVNNVVAESYRQS